MFDAMTRRHTPITINGTVHEKAIFMRNSRSSYGIFQFENVYRGVHSGNSIIKNGDQVFDGTNYFLVETVRTTPDKDKVSVLLKCNESAVVQRYESILDENLNPLNEWKTTFPSIKVNAEYITGALREKEPGLLANAVLKILMQRTPGYTTYDDPESDFAVNDRIVIGPSNYQVMAIDAFIMKGLLTVQVAEDVRQ